MNKMNKKSKVSPVVMAGVVVASAIVGAVGGIVLYNPEPVIETVYETVELPVEVQVKGDDVIQYVDKEVIVEVEVENTDSYDKLEAALKDREIFDDAYSVLEQVGAEDEAIALAIAEIKAELAEELEDEDFVNDEDDVDDIDIEEDFEDIEILRSDFEDEEYRFVFEVEFEDEDLDETFDLLVEVEVEDNHAKIRNIEYK